MSDLIDRRAALGIIQSVYPGMPRVPWLRKNWKKRYEPYINEEKVIRTLPSAQPEIIMCKNCKHFDFCTMYGCEEDDFLQLCGLQFCRKAR